MKISKLIAENVKKLVAVEITPTGSLVEITGKNGHGKTSVLDSIWWAIAGAGNVQAQPIRNGADKARIKLDMGELVVTRTFSRKDDGYTTQIVVETAAGAKLNSPQKVLDELLGALSFDPLEFSRLPAADQFEVLKSFVPAVDFKAIEEANAVDYNKRTEANRRFKELEAQANAITLPETLPEPVDVEALVAQLAGAADSNTALAARKARREEVSRSVDTDTTRAEKLIEEANALRDRAMELDKEAQTLMDQAATNQERLNKAPALPPPLDTSALQNQITAARATNALADKATQKQQLLKAAADWKATSASLTEGMEARNKTKQEAIALAKMPFDGLGFGNGIVLLNGVPFDQASDAQKLTASVRIAMSQNPKLKVLRIRDGSLLDSESLALLAKMLEDNDWQCWIEIVDSSGKTGFVLEDGRLKGQTIAAPKPAAPTPPPKPATKPVIPEPLTGNLLGDDL